jgi:SAM-dependent methyltransferase
MTGKSDTIIAPSASTSAGGTVPPCPLCATAQVSVVDRYPVESLRKAWAVFGVHFPKSVWAAFNGRQAIEMFRCSSCGFQFCDPTLAGDGAFYAELERQKQTYYPPDVPEFSRTLAWAKAKGWRTVLDVGCGAGAFLDRARAAGLQATGVELNLQAAENCRRRGHTVHTRLLSELRADKSFPKFDLVTIFQVLEHVSDPVGFLKEAAEFLGPHGCLSVAVPNDRGIYRICPREPHQWPPHHVTRWRLQDLEKIGQRCHLDVLEVGANQLLGYEAEHFWTVRNQIAATLGEAPLPGGRFLPKALSFIYRKLGLRYVISGMGTSVYALYQRADHEHR